MSWYPCPTCCGVACLCSGDTPDSWIIESLTGIAGGVGSACTGLNLPPPPNVNSTYTLDIVGLGCVRFAFVVNIGVTYRFSVDTIDVDASNFKLRLTITEEATNKSAILESGNILKTQDCCGIYDIAMTYVSQDSGMGCDFSSATAVVSALCDLGVGETCCEYWTRVPSAAPDELSYIDQLGISATLERSGVTEWTWTGSVLGSCGIEMTSITVTCDAPFLAVTYSTTEGCQISNANANTDEVFDPCLCPFNFSGSYDLNGCQTFCIFDGRSVIAIVGCGTFGMSQQTTPIPTQTSSGTVAIVGSIAQTSVVSTQSATGSVTVSGTASQTSVIATQAATGVFSISGTAAQTCVVETQSVAGSTGITGTVVQTCIVETQVAAGSVVSRCAGDDCIYECQGGGGLWNVVDDQCNVSETCVCGPSPPNGECVEGVNEGEQRNVGCVQG